MLPVERLTLLAVSSSLPSLTPNLKAFSPALREVREGSSLILLDVRNDADGSERCRLEGWRKRSQLGGTTCNAHVLTCSWQAAPRTLRPNHKRQPGSLCMERQP